MKTPDKPASASASSPEPSKSALSDAEVICTWMEPKPSLNGGPVSDCHKSPREWWAAAPREGRERSVLYSRKWAPCRLTLDALHEVEARLTEEQWRRYQHVLALPDGEEALTNCQLIHASAVWKIRALAATLRSRVLPEDEGDATTGLSGNGSREPQ